MTERTAQLLKMLELQPNDPFLVYALAMEEKKSGDHAAALARFENVISLDPGYCYAYYQQGLTHEMMGDTEAAKAAYERGIAAAKTKGDAHAQGEIQAALDMLD